MPALCARSQARSFSLACSFPLSAARPPGSRPRPLAAALSGLFSGAGAPRRLPGTSRRRRAPRARLKLAGGPGWRRPGRPGRAGLKGLQWRLPRWGREAGPGAGGGGRVQAESRDCGAPGRWAPVGGVGSRHRLFPLLLLLLPLPCLPAASRWDSEPLHKAPPADGLRLRVPRPPLGGASPETRAKRSGYGGGARAHTLCAPGGRPAKGPPGTEPGTQPRVRNPRCSPTASTLPSPNPTGRSTGLGDDLEGVEGSVLPSSPSSSPLSPALLSPPPPKSRLCSYGFSEFAPQLREIATFGMTSNSSRNTFFWWGGKGVSREPLLF